jgi:hypothetical protein
MGRKTLVKKGAGQNEKKKEYLAPRAGLEPTT